MNVALQQPGYRVPAALLALLVHGAFFSFLYFGLSWQSQVVLVPQVSLYGSLPEPVAPPPVEQVQPKRPEPPPPPPKPKVVEKPPEIAVPEKKKKAPPPKPVPQEKPKPKPKPAPAKSPQPVVDVAEREAALQRERARQAEADALATLMDEYVGKINSKIRRNIVMPPEVADDARAEFAVTLLPGGGVLSARLTKSSGNAAYDAAVERAILKAQPLPLPPDVMLFNRFRNLKLGFRPRE